MFINDTWNELYTKSQDQFNEKSLSKIRGYYPDEFNFLKSLAMAMIAKDVSSLSREDCEALWLEERGYKKSLKRNQLLKNKLQTDKMLQTLLGAGFLCIVNDDDSYGYQLIIPWFI